jgi:hypothetical protein
MSKGKVAIIAVAAFVAVDALAIITGNGDRIGVGLSALALFAAYIAPMFIASTGPDSDQMARRRRMGAGSATSTQV